MNRFIPVWRGYPLRPWIVQDTAVNLAYIAPKATAFWHGDFPAAVKLADRLNKGER